MRRSAAGLCRFGCPIQLTARPTSPIIETRIHGPRGSGERRLDGAGIGRIGAGLSRACLCADDALGAVALGRLFDRGFIRDRLRDACRGKRSARPRWAAPASVRAGADPGFAICHMPVWVYPVCVIEPGASLAMVRSFAEHRAGGGAPPGDRRERLDFGSALPVQQPPSGASSAAQAADGRNKPGHAGFLRCSLSPLSLTSPRCRRDRPPALRSRARAAARGIRPSASRRAATQCARTRTPPRLRRPNRAPPAHPPPKRSA